MDLLNGDGELVAFPSRHKKCKNKCKGHEHHGEAIFKLTFALSGPRFYFFSKCATQVTDSNLLAISLWCVDGHQNRSKMT